MNNIIKNDVYRFGKSALLYGTMLLTIIISCSLTVLIRQDIRLGISVFGNLTAFRGVGDIIRIGLLYQRGLGIFIAILLSALIGQEYQWKTWQHKWMANKSRTRIYLSKFILSSAISSAVFGIFQIAVLLASSQTGSILTVEYAAMIISGVFIYAALGAVICLLSMLIKNSAASIIACLCYVMFSETLASVMGNISSFSATVSGFAGWCVRHSIYGMATLVSAGSVSPGLAVSIIINALAVMFLSTVIGLMFFRRYEL